MLIALCMYIVPLSTYTFCSGFQMLFSLTNFVLFQSNLSDLLVPSWQTLCLTGVFQLRAFDFCKWWQKAILWVYDLYDMYTCASEEETVWRLLETLDGCKNAHIRTALLFLFPVPGKEHQWINPSTLKQGEEQEKKRNEAQWPHLAQEMPSWWRVFTQYFNYRELEHQWHMGKGWEQEIIVRVKMSNSSCSVKLLRALKLT